MNYCLKANGEFIKKSNIGSVKSGTIVCAAVLG